MSGRIVGEILDNAPEDLTRLELLTLIALAEAAREPSRIATHKTTRDALADRTRSTPATMKNVLRNLRDRGLIKVTNGTAHRGKAQHYEVMKLTPEHRAALWTGGSPDAPIH